VCEDVSALPMLVHALPFPFVLGVPDLNLYTRMITDSDSVSKPFTVCAEGLQSGKSGKLLQASGESGVHMNTDT